MDTFFVVDFRCNGLVDGHCSEVYWISTLSARETQLSPAVSRICFYWISTLSARETQQGRVDVLLGVDWISTLSARETKH